MKVTNYTPEDLKKLPLRAIVALAARCARRVEHLAFPSQEGPEKENCRAVVSEAIRVTEDFARGLPCPSLESVIQEATACRQLAEGDLVCQCAMAAVVLAAQSASTAEHAIKLRGEPTKDNPFEGIKTDFYPRTADISADLTAQYTFMAASEAFDAVGHEDNFVKAAIADYEKLRALDLGSFPHEGKPVDLSPTGPLGP
jgi:hypothetical protein